MKIKTLNHVKDAKTGKWIEPNTEIEVDEARGKAAVFGGYAVEAAEKPEEKKHETEKTTDRSGAGARQNRQAESGGYGDGN